PSGHKPSSPPMPQGLSAHPPRPTRPGPAGGPHNGGWPRALAPASARPKNNAAQRGLFQPARYGAPPPPPAPPTPRPAPTRAPRPPPNGPAGGYKNAAGRGRPKPGPNGRNRRGAATGGAPPPPQRSADPPARPAGQRP